MEEHGRIRNSKKNSTNINLKVKFDVKETGNSSSKNLKLNNKKSKNNSMEKISKYEFNNNFFGDSINNKKKTRNLNNSFSDINNNDNKSQKFSKTISQISLYKNIYTNKPKLSKSKSKKSINEKNSSYTKENDIKLPEPKNLNPKEKACLILAYSNILRLRERAIFSRSYPKFKSIITKKQILETNKYYLTEKLQELEQQIDKCNTKLKSKFSASKTAEITLNFITFTIETDFKLNFFENIDDETEKKYCYNYVKLLYLVLGEDYNEVEEDDLIINLYSKISQKNYSNIKDYLFYLYIQNQKNLGENKAVDNIVKINDIISTTPDIFNIKITTKFDKFILYCSYILNEIINFANNRLDTIKLINDCKNFIDIINIKLNLYNGKSNPSNKKNV